MQLYNVHLHCRSRPGCTYMYVNIPPTNLLANLSRQGKTKQKKHRKLQCLMQGKEAFFKLSTEVVQENEG